MAKHELDLRRSHSIEEAEARHRRKKHDQPPPQTLDRSQRAPAVTFPDRRSVLNGAMTANKMRGVVVTGAWLLSIGASLSVTACEKGASKAPADNAPVPATTPPTNRPRRRRPPPPNPDDIPPPADVKAPPADAEKTASGLASKVLTPGTGKEKPAAADTVKVHYTGWTTDGHMFDSSVKRGAAGEVPARQRDQGLDRRRCS